MRQGGCTLYDDDSCPIAIEHFCEANDGCITALGTSLSVNGIELYKLTSKRCGSLSVPLHPRVSSCVHLTRCCCVLARETYGTFVC